MNIILLLTYFLSFCLLHAHVITSPSQGFYSPSLRSPRSSSAPYITGDTFRSVCDFVVDERQIPLDTTHMQDGDVIFVKTDYLSFFFNDVVPYITRRYILVTHNSDASAPGQFAHHLNDHNLVAWFGQNGDAPAHPKFFPIPIGFANAYYPHGDVQIINRIYQSLTQETQRQYLLHLNFEQSTHPERVYVRDYFADKPWCNKVSRKPYADYLQDFTQAKFVISPRGNGLDCHRTWEALLMGAIPVVKHSTIDRLFDGLPVVLVNDWHEVTEEFLNQTYEKMKYQTFHQERVFAPYWIQKIADVKASVKPGSKLKIRLPDLPMPYAIQPPKLNRWQKMARSVGNFFKKLFK